MGHFTLTQTLYIFLQWEVQGWVCVQFLSWSAKHALFLFIRDEEPTSTNSASGHFVVGQRTRKDLSPPFHHLDRTCVPSCLSEQGTRSRGGILTLFSQWRRGQAITDKATTEQMTLIHSITATNVFPRFFVQNIGLLERKTIWRVTLSVLYHRDAS